MEWTLFSLNLHLQLVLLRNVTELTIKFHKLKLREIKIININNIQITSTINMSLKHKHANEN